MPYLGEIAAVATAACWTFSSLFFALATKRVSGVPTNQFRLILAVPLLCVLHRWTEGVWWPPSLGERLPQLVASGLAGLVLGDIGYFYALGVIGPRLGSVLMSTWPAMAVGIAWLWRGAVPTWAMAGGIAVTLAGVALVLLRGGDGKSWQPSAVAPWQWRLAILGALLGALGQALGSVLVAVATLPGPDSPLGLPGISAALVRMLSAALGITVVALLRGQPLGFLRVLGDQRALGSALGGTAFGPVGGVWLSMVALKHAPVGIAATLMALTPLFMMPVAKWSYGARIGLLGILGTLLAITGVGWLLAVK